MRLDLDAKVRARDGEDIGSVGRAIVDPRTNEVTHIVVRTGTIFGRDITVPREDLERGSLDGDTIQLDLTKDELREFPDFVMENYGAPPPTWVAPAGYGFPASGYAWPIAADPMDGPMPTILPEDEIAHVIERFKQYGPRGKTAPATKGPAAKGKAGKPAKSRRKPT